jgi:hypothetical protein
MGKTTQRAIPAPISRLADQHLSAEQILALQRLPERFEWRSALAELEPERPLPAESYLSPYVIALLDQITALQSAETFQRLRAYLPALSALSDQHPPEGVELRRQIIQAQIANIIIPLASQEPEVDLQHLGCYQQSDLLDSDFQYAVGKAIYEVYHAVNQAYGPNSSNLPAGGVVERLLDVGIAKDQFFHIRLADLQRQRADARADVPGSSYQQLIIQRLINNLNNDIGYGLIALAQNRGRSLQELHLQAQDGKFAILDQLIASYQQQNNSDNGAN